MCAHATSHTARQDLHLTRALPEPVAACARQEPAAWVCGASGVLRRQLALAHDVVLRLEGLAVHPLLQHVARVPRKALLRAPGGSQARSGQQRNMLSPLVTSALWHMHCASHALMAQSQQPVLKLDAYPGLPQST